MIGFISNWTALAASVNQNAHNKGFYDQPRTFGDEVALMHSELSEALEGFRAGDPPSEKIPEFTSTEEEFADTVIRIMDSAYERGLRLPEAILAKVGFNRTRPYRHGGKKL